MPKRPVNKCVDHNALLNFCATLNVVCEWPSCDDYTEIPRKQKQEKQKRDFVQEICNELDKMGVPYEVGLKYHDATTKSKPLPKTDTPDWF